MDCESSVSGQRKLETCCCKNLRQSTENGCRFCIQCGLEENNYVESSGKKGWGSIKQALLFVFIHGTIVYSFGYLDFFQTLNWSIAINSLLAVVAVIFFTINWSSLKDLLLWPNFSPALLLRYCSIAILGSLVVSFIFSEIFYFIYSRHISFYYFYSSHKHSLELIVIFKTIIPALFEEVAFRGFLLGKLLNSVGRKKAIILSSVVFAFMHRSYISFFWITPFAILVSQIRIKEKTLWYGVFIHFCFNLTATILEIYYMNFHN